MLKAYRIILMFALFPSNTAISLWWGAISKARYRAVYAPSLKRKFRFSLEGTWSKFFSLFIRGAGKIVSSPFIRNGQKKSWRAALNSHRTPFHAKSFRDKERGWNRQLIVVIESDASFRCELKFPKKWSLLLFGFKQKKREESTKMKTKNV